MKRKIIEVFFTKQFLVFVMVGVINTLNGLLFPWIFSHILNANIAYVISYIPSLTISYFLNSIFTFKDREFAFSKYIKFVVSYIPNFIIQNICFIVVYNILGMSNIVAIIIASVIGVPVTFLLSKFFVFKGAEKENTTIGEGTNE